MKKYLIIAMATLGLLARAETNKCLTIDTPKEKESVATTHEITFGFDGVTSPTTGHTEAGLAFSYSIQPTKYPVWCGISQEFGWQNGFAGATDLDLYPSWNLWKEKLYLNTGWSVGAVYDTHTLEWRSGPEVSLQYYMADSVFSWVQANYDLIITGAIERNIRLSGGIGWAF